MKLVHSLIFLSIILGNCGRVIVITEPEGESNLVSLGFNSSDNFHMTLLKERLDLNGIPYEIEPDGNLILVAKYEEQYEAIQESIDKIMTSSRIVIFEDNAAMGNFKDILDSYDIYYKEEEIQFGTIIEWYSTDGDKPDAFEEELAAFEGKYSIIEKMPSNN